MAGKIELPEHIATGKYVKVAEWVGRIDDICIGETRIVLVVTSPKIGGNYELLEYHPESPDLIRPATADDWRASCQRYIDAARYRIDCIEKLL